jgi:hypothetical protein
VPFLLKFISMRRKKTILVKKKYECPYAVEVLVRQRGQLFRHHHSRLGIVLYCQPVSVLKISVVDQRFLIAWKSLDRLK